MGASLLGDLAGGAIGAVGNLLGTGISAIFNSGQAQEQRDYETQMADTTYQRGEADLKAAGLNPVLAAGGATDPTPNYTPATISPPELGSDFMSGFSSAQSAQSSIQAQDQSSQSFPVTLDTLKQTLLNLQASGALTEDQVYQLDAIVNSGTMAPAALQAFHNLVLLGKGLSLQNSATSYANTVAKFNAAVANYSDGPLGVTAKAVGNIILPYAGAAVGAGTLLK